jgi:hypothetical protein
VGGDWPELAAAGAGFIFTGDRRRGWILLAILNGLFALGLLMRGSVIPPVFDPRSPAFNVINVLTFAVSLGSGGHRCCVSERRRARRGRSGGWRANRRRRRMIWECFTSFWRAR